MKFGFKPAPHIKNGRNVANVMEIVTSAILFVLGWSAVSRFFIFGWQASLHIVFMALVAILGTVFAEYAFHIAMDLMEKKKFANFKERITTNTEKVFSNAPIITALILAAALLPTTNLYIVFIVAIFAEIFGKLVFGGFGQNVFNPVAVGLIFGALSFGNSSLNPSSWYGYGQDIVVGATPIARLFVVNDWAPSAFQLQNFFSTFWSNLLLGNSYGAVAEHARIAIVIACAYMIFKKVIDWVIPAVYIGTIFVIALIFGIYLGTDAILYPVMHLLSGGIVFASVFMLTDPVTGPINRQGKIIFTILIAAFTMLIRLSTDHSEGISFAILLANILVPIIDKKTANVTTINLGKKWASLGAIFGVSTIIVLLFAIFI